MIVPVGEQLVDNYQVIKLPDDGQNTATSSAQHLVETETALLARIEFLEAQLAKMDNDKKSTDHKKSPFSVEQIKHDDHLLSFYTGFSSFAIFWSFISSLDLLLTSFITGGQNQMQRNDTVPQN